MSRLHSYLETANDLNIKLKRIDTSTGKINRLYCGNNEKGYLDFDKDDEDTFFLIMVDVKPEYQKLEIATMLLKKFFEIVSKNNGAMDASGFLEDGEKYLRPVIERLKNKYRNITYL